MLSRSDRLLVEHVAAQRGFDLVDLSSIDMLTVSSSLVPGLLSIRQGDLGDFMIETNLPLVTSALRQEFPSGNGRAVRARDETTLYGLLGRAFQLCGSLPDGPLKTFEMATVGLPRTTEVERLVLQRIGQDIFRTALERYWDNRCPITGIEDAALLRASHIKPWADSNDAERLDVYNGVLLAAHLDAAFDKYLMTILVDGSVVFSSRLSGQAMDVLNPGRQSLNVPLSPLHYMYLEGHHARFAELERA